MRQLTLILLTLLAALQSLHAQRTNPLGIAYYNVDKLYDTIPSPFYNDQAYTPKGDMHWDSERYRHKINNIVQVIDSISMPLVALYGIENKQVVEDIVRHSKNDYAYIHKSSNSHNGLDFALLYYGDMFFPREVTPWQGALCIEGEVGEMPLTIIISHGCKSLGVLLNNKNKPQDNNIIIFGSAGKLNFKKLGLYNALQAAEKQGRGNRIIQSQWKMHDYIVTNIEGKYCADVYIKEWLLDKSGHPLASHNRGKYLGGYSSWLPIFIYFDKIFVH